jgi:hypothetical protein
MGLPEGDSKESSLHLVAEILERERVSYALIGGVAVQLHTAEPRSTLDIDLAVRSYADIPRDALVAAGFEHTGRHPHSDNWRAPGRGPSAARTAVQFSAEDSPIVEAVARATTVDLGPGVHLRVATVADLIRLKLVAAEASDRRASKREHDVADVLALLEEHADAASPELIERVRQVRASLLAIGPGSTGR